MSKKHKHDQPKGKFINMTITQIPKDKLFVEGEFQRDLREHKVRAIVENFDEYQVNPLKVHKEPDGRYSIFNGQHTENSMDRTGYTHMPCIVYEGLTQQQKAHIFRMQDEFKNRITSYEQFKASTVEGVPDSLALKQILENAGMPLGKVNAISALQKLVELYDPQDIVRGLHLTVMAWHDKARLARGEIFAGMIDLAQFTRSHNIAIPDEKIAERIGRKPSAEYVAKLKPNRRGIASSDVRKAMREILTDAYNNQLKHDRIPLD
ncbi:hypothetical protein FACS1894184_09250 [Clostridia bacterium]|nr:hypothetical protein FACS1894184_09250 [Clostridia bacterium]